jgi:hypothetical protein
MCTEKKYLFFERRARKKSEECVDVKSMREEEEEVQKSATK